MTSREKSELVEPDKSHGLAVNTAGRLTSEDELKKQIQAAN